LIADVSHILLFVFPFYQLDSFSEESFLNSREVVDNCLKQRLLNLDLEFGRDGEKRVLDDAEKDFDFEVLLDIRQRVLNYFLFDADRNLFH